MLSLIYMLITFATGGSALWEGATYAGVAGIVGPIVCWFAGSGLKGSVMEGRLAQRIVGFVAAVLFAVIGIGIVHHSGFSPGLFGHSVSGIVWCLIGLVVGWIGTTRQRAG